MKKLIVAVLLASTLLMCACDTEQAASSSATQTSDTSAAFKLPDISETAPDTSKTTFTLYYPDEEYLFFETKELEFDGSYMDIIAQMKAEGILKGTSEALSFRIFGSTGYLDMNKAFNKDVSPGAAYEYLTVACIVNTFIDCYGVSDVMITCEGNWLSTEHFGTYVLPISKYENVVIDDGTESSSAAPAPESEEASAEEASAEETTVDDSSVAEESTFLMYYPDQNMVFLESKELTFDGTAEDIIVKMKDAGALPESTVLNSFEIKDGKGYMDLNKAFATDVSAGSTYEVFTMGALINTFIEHYGISEIHLTCDGGPFATEHVGTYDWPLGKFEFDTAVEESSAE